MSLFSVSNQSLHKNTEHYGFLRQRENLYWATPQGWMLVTEYTSSSDESSARPTCGTLARATGSPCPTSRSSTTSC
ncbi:hypothetical protein BAE44_0007629 [Dichanthelium oligosanthes]|uniref:Uncharacterized protein n=1 Tax=Dichanthelium oligosanthes TaxID=888268 RepID=A0A1E5W1U0_9POAL|nr:hypothetical protein BAE44_0007629 [Dichanthelium oligosanthes]